MGKYNQAEKLKILDKHNEIKQRSETDVITNKERTVVLGNDKVEIKQLIWDDANTFEDKILELVQAVSDVELNTEKLDIAGIIERILSYVLRDGLLELASLATEGKVTLEYIRQVRATKDDVIKLVMESIMLNYAYVKNLLTLGKKLI